MKISGKSKNLNMNKTEISLNIILIRYYVVFSRVFTYSTGYMQINVVLSSASLSSC